MRTKHNAFRSSPAETKAATTNSAARQIIEQQAVERDAKTNRLRALRLQRDDAAPAEAPVRAKGRSKRATGPKGNG